LDSIAGKLKHASATLLVGIDNEKQVDVLQKASFMWSYPIQVENHTFFNYTQGVVSINSLGVFLDEISQLLHTSHFQKHVG
jgi:hypothetical protein